MSGESDADASVGRAFRKARHAGVDEAGKLATALNWHGATEGKEIKNRRSTLLGEKGYGLGVCGTWRFYGDP